MRLFVVVLALSSVVAAQTAAPKRQPARKQGATTPRAAAPAVDPDEGSVSDDTYTNRYFGLQYTFPDNLDVQDQSSFMEGQLDQSGRTFVLLAAYGEMPENKAREGVVVVADAAAPQYGPFADGADYLRKITGPIMQKHGYEFTALTVPAEVGGVRFYRADFHKDGVFQSQFVTLRRGYALSFTLVAPSAAELAHLTDSLKTVKFAPAATK